MYAYKKFTWQLVLAIIAVLLSSCAPSFVPPPDGIEAIQHGTTLWGIERVLAGGWHTEAYRGILNKDWFVLVWNSSEGWFSVCLDASKQEARYWGELTGQWMSSIKLKEFLSMIDGAFERTTAEEAAFSLSQGVGLAESWIAKIASAELMPVFVIEGMQDLPSKLLPQQEYAIP